jgi:protein-L-isoaspartate(D-aspartate) O-methyltransferase
MTAFDAERARRNMILQQIRPWEVIDQRVLDTLQTVPREDFVPGGYRGLAYADIEVPIGHGEVMLAPKIEAKLLQALAIRPVDRVLEIGTGSGYLTACLARLGGHVVTIDLNADFIEQARGRLTALGIGNVEFLAGDAFATELPGAPFDVVAVTGSVTLPPERLEGLLNDGGRLFVVVGEPPVQEAQLVTRIREGVSRRESLFETVVPPLRNAPRPEAFVF